MNCDEYKRLVFRKIDGELSPDEEKTLLEHFAGCPSCQELERKFLRLDSLLQKWSIPSAPDDIPVRTMARLAIEEKAKTGWLPVPRAVEKALAPLVVGMGLAVGVLLGLELGGQLSPPPAQTVLNGDVEWSLFTDSPSGSLTEAFQTISVVDAGR